MLQATATGLDCILLPPSATVASRWRGVSYCLRLLMAAIRQNGLVTNLLEHLVRLLTIESK